MNDAEAMWAAAMKAAEERLAYQDRNPMAEMQQQIHELRNQLDTLRLNTLVDAALRDANPGLNDAWEKYQILLRMAKSEFQNN